VKGEPGRPKADEETPYNVRDLQVTCGNGKAYTLSRLKRETPELFASVVRGELSANAAAVKAGWRKVKTPLELLRAAWVRANAPERMAHLTGIRDELPELWSKVSREGAQHD